MSKFTKSTRRKLRGIGRTAYNRSRVARQAMDLIDMPMPHLEGLNVKVFLYDPLAHARLYKRWDDQLDDDEQTGEGNSEYEIVPDGLECVIKNSEGKEVASWTFKPEDNEDEDEGATLQLKENIDPEETYTVEFLTLASGDEPSADLTCWVINGNVEEEELDNPQKRNTFNVKGYGEYRFRIWLRPKTIVLHWSVGGYEPEDAEKGQYHFLVTGDGIWRPGGKSRAEHDDEFVTSWKMWWHNLQIDNFPDLDRGLSKKIKVGTQLNSIDRKQFYWDNDWQNSNGYFTHAGGFNSSSVGVTICAMNGAPNSPNSWKPYKEEDGEHVPDPDNWGNNPNPMKDNQVNKFLEEVAQLCKAWKLNPLDPNNVCTHFEANELHSGTSNKWDITWLQKSYQDSYGAEFLIKKKQDLKTLLIKEEDGGLTADEEKLKLLIEKKYAQFILKDNVDGEDDGDLSIEEMISNKFKSDEDIKTTELCQNGETYRRFGLDYNGGIPLIDPEFPENDWESFDVDELPNNNTTDRVGDYLREIIKQKMDLLETLWVNE